MTPTDTALIDWVAALFPVAPGPGRPVTVLFTDIAGYTAHAARRGDDGAARLLHAHDAAVLPAVRRHMGRILKRLGDGMMVVFVSPADALAAARAIHGTTRIALRIGIHTGTARSRAGDLIGHAVNVAARITERARGGEILVSLAVRRATRGRFRRTRPLHIPGRSPIAVFRVMAEDT